MAVTNKIFIPALISSVTYQPVRTLPHVYFYNGLKDCEQYFIQHYAGNSTNVSSSAQTKFPYVDYYDGLEPGLNSNSLLFFNETPPYGVTPTGSLYTEYWETYVSLLYNPRTRLFKASAIIPLADYFQMELNDIVQWRGNYYHLRAINDYNLKDGTCQLELLGPIIRDIAATDTFDCTFDFSSSFEGSITTTTTTTTTTSTTTTAAPTTTTTTTGGPTTTTTSTTTLAPTTTTTTLATYTIEYLMVAGGGGGASRHAGGGGAGGYLTGSLNVSGSTPSFAGGGGGGASQIGFSGTRVSTENRPGTGGSGSAWFDGVFRAGGGGGAGQYTGGTGGQSTLQSSGSVGGGGRGGWAYAGAEGSVLNGTAGTINTGGGGGAGAGRDTLAGNGASGGSGITIIRYPGSQRGTGGQITSSGSYTYHTFTSSGDFTPN